MPTAWNVITGIAANSSVYPGEAPPVVDRENMIVTVTLPVLFRGTRQAFLNAFKFGAQNCPQGAPACFASDRKMSGWFRGLPGIRTGAAP